MEEGHGPKRVVRKAIRMWTWWRTNSGVRP